MTLTYALTLSSADHSDATLRNSVLADVECPCGTITVSGATATFGVHPSATTEDVAALDRALNADDEVISYTVDVGDVWLSDYRTGEDLDGAVSAELALASRSAGHTGVVAAEQDADGIWQLVREDDAFRDGVRSVYVSGV